jgi:hypothetical protein
LADKLKKGISKTSKRTALETAGAFTGFLYTAKTAFS